MRLFFGLSLPDEIRRCAASHAHSLEAVLPGRYALAENYHITLAFLGDVPEERVSAAQAVLQRCIRSIQPPLLSLGETGYFGRPQSAILIIRIQDAGALLPIHQSLIQALDEAGLPADHGPFSPHITLARRVSVPHEGLPSCFSLSFSAVQAHLYLSARNSENILTYTPIYTVPFCT